MTHGTHTCPTLSLGQVVVVQNTGMHRIGKKCPGCWPYIQSTLECLYSTTNEPRQHGLQPHTRQCTVTAWSGSTHQPRHHIHTVKNRAYRSSENLGRTTRIPVRYECYVCPCEYWASVSPCTKTWKVLASSPLLVSTTGPTTTKENVIGNAETPLNGHHAHRR